MVLKEALVSRSQEDFSQSVLISPRPISLVIQLSSMTQIGTFMVEGGGSRDESIHSFDPKVLVAESWCLFDQSLYGGSSDTNPQPGKSNGTFLAPL